MRKLHGAIRHHARFDSSPSIRRFDRKWSNWTSVGRPVVFVCCYLTGHVYNDIAPKLTASFMCMP